MLQANGRQANGEYGGRTSTLARQRKSRTARPAAGGATGERVYDRFLPALLWDGSLSNVAGEDIHTCPAAQVADCEAGSGGGNGGACVRPFPPAFLCGGSLSNVAGERPRQRKSLTAMPAGGGSRGNYLPAPPRGWIEAF